MANYNGLKSSINNNIYENQTQQITGTVLNAILNEMVTTLGAGYQFAGVAYVGMIPAEPDGRIFYLAGEGIYTSFDGIQVPQGKLGILKWDSRWHLETIDGLGGGANLTGYVTVASTDDLPDEGVATLGYLCGTNLYLYVGEGGDTKEGKYQNCGSFRGPQGDSVQDVEQTQTSHENGGVNKIKFTLSNGQAYEFQVRNGTTSTGLFPTLADLQAAYPTPVVGQYAFVGSGFPADIYVCTTAGAWTDSGEDYDGDNVDLTDYATKAEVNELELKVSEISGQFYGVFTSASNLPSGVLNKGYAYVGSEEPYELYIFDGTSWTDTESTVSGVHFSDNELSIGTVVEGATADALVTGNAPYQKLNLTLPKAGNPFKGLWDSLADLKDAITAQSGFYAYVLGTPPATTAKIYLYDSAEVSNKYWKDSGITIDLNDATVKPLSENAKNAILRAFSKVAWIDENGQQYIDDLANALLMKQIVSIDAVFTQGTSVYGTNSSLDSLKENLGVTATYDDGTIGVLADSDYELSGTLTRGTSTITVTADGHTDTFTVTVVTYVLEKEQFVCFGLTGRYQPTTPGPYPYTDGAYTNRFSYPFFDLLVVAGKTYQFSIISSYNTINIGVQGYTQVIMNTIASNGNFTGNTDSGWQNYPSFTYTIPADVVCIRVTGRRDSSNPNLTQVPIERLIIDEVV